jgi:hypothetical protein
MQFPTGWRFTSPNTLEPQGNKPDDLPAVVTVEVRRGGAARRWRVSAD